MYSIPNQAYQKFYVSWLYTRVLGGGEGIVYCTKCGTNNADSIKVCVQCGVLFTAQAVIIGLTGAGNATEGRMVITEEADRSSAYSSG